MDARELQDLLRDLLAEVVDARDDEDHPLADLADRAGGVRDVATYEEADLLTADKGLVVGCEDGGEFQVTIVRSRAGRKGA